MRTRPCVTSTEIRSRLARYARLVPNPEQKVDARLHGHRRDLMSVIGHGVAEDPMNTTWIADAEDFHVTYIRADPGNGASLHTHETVEVFIPLESHWTVYWNEGPMADSIDLTRFDCISIPKGVMRGYVNSGICTGLMMNIVGGDDPGKVHWTQNTLNRAARTGLSLDADGKLVSLDIG
jgi:mannose-6-phosphate isomerase-like protein (cupin superfamily)